MNLENGKFSLHITWMRCNHCRKHPSIEDWIQKNPQFGYKANMVSLIEKQNKAISEFISRCPCVDGKAHLQNTPLVDCPRCTWARRILSETKDIPTMLGMELSTIVNVLECANVDGNLDDLIARIGRL